MKNLKAGYAENSLMGGWDSNKVLKGLFFTTLSLDHRNCNLLLIDSVVALAQVQLSNLPLNVYLLNACSSRLLSHYLGIYF